MSTDSKEIGFGQGSLSPAAPVASRAGEFAGVHQLFERHARLHPESIAVCCTGGSLEYGELNRSANRLAHRLRLHGVGAESLVGLCVPRGSDLVAGALGILKAGGAYVALDAAHPPARIAELVADAGLTLVVTTESLADMFADGTRTVLIDERRALAGFSDADPPEAPGAGPGSLAYAVYTSGSTGKPKASMLEHRGLANMAAEQARIFGISTDSRVLQFASFAFDAATFEWVMALANGAQLYLPDEATVKSPRALSHFVAVHRITHATLPPVILPLLEVREWRHVSTLIVAGEAVSRELAERWSRGRNFFNAYGPSEMTVWCTTGRFDPGQALAHIGQPIAQCNCHVLDAAGQPVATGEAGELYLAGVGIARGYLNRPEATAERFVINTLSPEVSSRLFRSGDRVRQLADGNLEFLGRVDRQVKVRGHRVEPEELERCLAGHPAVSAVAVEPQVWSGVTRLVAYVAVDAAAAQAAALEPGAGPQWQDLFDRTYRKTQPAAEAFADFTGWTSSFTCAPIPVEAMQDWVDSTVARIRSYQPRRVLEIGCGTGLLLGRLVRDCGQYVGTDISTEVLGQLSKNLPLLGADARKVELFRAQDIERAVGARRFDTIIVNSVIQYFLHEAHLRQQLAGLFARLEPGGVLFVGDVRHLGWNRQFHADIERFQAAEFARDAGFEARVESRVQNDHELVVAPELFLDLAQTLDGVGRVELLPKLGRHATEMNIYRYDAVMHRSSGATASAPRADEVGWAALGSLAAVEALLCEGALATSGAIIVRDVPYPRLGGQGVDPLEMIRLARRHGAEAELGLGTGEACFGFHVLLRGVPASEALSRQIHLPAKPVGPYCNRPLLRRARRGLEAALRAHLRERLPPYLQPGAFVFLDSLPMNSNGKVDRDALPAPVGGVGRGREPLTPTQEKLREVWCELLGQPDVGAEDNFHALGGDSLAAVRMLDAVESSFGIELEFTEVQQSPTLAALAQRIELAVARRALLAASPTSEATQGAREVLRL